MRQLWICQEGIGEAPGGNSSHPGRVRQREIAGPSSGDRTRLPAGLRSPPRGALNSRPGALCMNHDTWVCLLGKRTRQCRDCMHGIKKKGLPSLSSWPYPHLHRCRLQSRFSVNVARVRRCLTRSRALSFVSDCPDTGETPKVCGRHETCR